MKTEDIAKASWGTSNKRKYLYAAIIGIALIILTEGFVQNDEQHLVNLPVPVSPTPTSTLTASTNLTTIKPQFYKKELVFKRTLAESDYPSIRTSALSSGYKALAVIPSSVVAPQVSFRMPQFINNSALNSYQALSTLGTQQYYSNMNVQQYLTGLSTQQYWNSLNTQQYLNKLNTWENTTVLNAQQYLNNLNNQQYLNNLNNQQYLNNFNNLNNQQYLNNLIRPNTFSNPIYIQPMPRIYVPPPSFNFP